MALVYSCCFWFSLRLGGILIATFSISLAVLISCCVAYFHDQNVKDTTAALIDSLNLIYTKPYLVNFIADPRKYLSLGISFSCIYVILCISYIYGAYKFNNILMIGYILVELLRLLFLTFFIITWLLVLKENTMDIGIHIGTSVTGSFVLCTYILIYVVGMFYLWICAANLPILINEMDLDQQNATINRLQKMVEINNTTFAQGSRYPEIWSFGVDLGLQRGPVLATTNFNRFDKFKPTLGNGFQHSTNNRFHR